LVAETVGPATFADANSGQADDRVDAVESCRIQFAGLGLPTDFVRRSGGAADEAANLVTAGLSRLRQRASDQARPAREQ
jgi:hypothetical protein